MQPPILAREHSERRVIAHRARRLLARFHHGMEHQLELLHGIAHHSLAQSELVAREHAGRRRAGDQRARVDHVCDPCRVGLGFREHVLHLAVVIEAAFGEIDANHLTGAEAPVLGNPLGRDGDHAGLGADNEHAVGGDAVAHGPKPVAVHSGKDPGAVGGGDGRRAVPRLHHAIAEVVESAVVGRHVLFLRPGVWDQQAMGRRHRATGPHHAFEHGVERHGIRRFRLDQREELAVIGRRRRRSRHASRDSPSSSCCRESC